jgi:hypothetical protein
LGSRRINQLIENGLLAAGIQNFFWQCGVHMAEYKQFSDEAAHEKQRHH